MIDNNLSSQVFNYLVARDLDPEIQKVPDGTDRTGKKSDTLLTFDFVAPSGKDYGTAVILLKPDSLSMYFGDSMARTMEGDDRQAWYDFLYALRNIARRNRVTYDWNDLSRLKHSLRGQAQLAESVQRLTGRRDRSWSAPQGQTRLLVHHRQSLDETQPRHVNIDKIFVETAEGERYLLPFRSLKGAKAMLEHVRQGGRPYDERGNHITEMVAEINLIANFRRANQHRVFEGDTQQLIEQTEEYYQLLKQNITRLSGHRGYSKYFENWKPNSESAGQIMVEQLRDMFIEKKIDQRVETALPLLARIQQGGIMKEVRDFEAWSEMMTEGTWSMPDTEVKKEKLRSILSEPLPVGPDALNATEQLYDIFGDDELFDQLSALAAEDPDADAREVILARLQELDIAFNTTDYMPAPATEPAAAPAPAPAPAPQPAVTEVIDTDGVMMQTPSNMSSEDSKPNVPRRVYDLKWIMDNYTERDFEDILTGRKSQDEVHSEIEARLAGGRNRASSPKTFSQSR